MRLAEDLAAATFRQTQEKLHQDLEQLKEHFKHKQEHADRAAPRFGVSV